MRTLCLVSVLASAAFAGEPEDGLYGFSDKADAPKVSGIGIGEKRTFEVNEARLVTQDNRNLEFQLQLTLPFTKEMEGEWHVLVVKGNAWRQSGSGSDREQSSSLHFQVSGRENADAVAAHFKIKPVLRSHPGHKMSVSFVPSKQEFAPDEDKVVTLRIENVGESSLFFQAGGRNRAARDNQFVFRASDGDKALPDIGSDQHFGGLSTIRELKPGGVFEAPVDLGKWFAFPKPGNFFVHGSWLVTIFPTAEYTTPLWEEWATAEFTVKIAGE